MNSYSKELLGQTLVKKKAIYVLIVYPYTHLKIHTMCFICLGIILPPWLEFPEMQIQKLPNPLGNHYADMQKGSTPTDDDVIFCPNSVT